MGEYAIKTFRQILQKIPLRVNFSHSEGYNIFFILQLKPNYFYLPSSLTYNITFYTMLSDISNICQLIISRGFNRLYHSFSTSIGIPTYDLHGIFIFDSCVINFVSYKFNITTLSNSGKFSGGKIKHT